MNLSRNIRANVHSHQADGVAVVAVLGMHRSGTSWLTGSLQQLGLEFGEVNTRARFNARGNRENRFLMRLHEAVLRDNGGSWRNPSYPNVWSSDRTEALRSHIAAMSERYGRWGFKDPRALLLMDEWKKCVGSLLRVGIYRHPQSVCQSLRNRDPDLSRQDAFNLWRFYNERLIAEYEATPLPIMRFDVTKENLHAQLACVADSLSLSRSSGLNEFYTSALVHHEDAAASVPAELRHVWTTLEAVRV